MEEHEAAGGHPTAPAGRGRGSYHSLYGESRDSSKYKEEVEDERERKRSEETSKEENVPGGRSSSSSQARSPRHLHDRSSSPPVKRTLTAVKAVSPAPFPSDCTEGDRLLDEAAALILREEEEKKEKECESRREEKIETDETHGAKEDEEENEGEYERNIKKALEEKRRREGVVSREELERCACPQKPLKNVLPGEEFNLSLAEVFRVLFHDLNHAQNPFHRILTDQKASITPPYPSWVPHDLLHLLFSSSLSSSRVASSKRQDEEEEEDVEKEKERLKNLLLTLSYSRPRRQLAYEMDLPVTTLNRLLGLPSRAQVEEKFSVFFLSRSCLLIQKDASLHGLPLSDCFFTRVRYRLTALNDEASLALDFSLLRDEEEEKRKKKKRKEEEGQKEKDEEKEEEESSNQEKEGAFQIQEECKKEDDKNISSTGKISSSSPSPRMQMDFEYEVIFTKSTFLQGKITSQGEAQVSADLSQFCMYSREALKEVYETTSSSSSPSSSMEKKGDMRIANKAAHSQVTEEEEEERKSLSLSDTRHDEDESRAKERSQGEKEGSSGPLLASASPSSSTCLLATPPSVHERGERREEAFSRVSFSPTSFLQNRLGRFNGRSVLSLRRIRRRCGTFLSSLRGLLLFLFSPSSFVGLLLHLLPSTPFEALLFIMVCALMWNVMSLQRDLHALLEGKIQREEGEGRDEEGRGRCLLGPGSNTSLLNAYLDFYTSRK
ncbi:gram domain-containing protein [Cystoisospora suis]|uniref:Gram domain-containing protein n=1 Tax=Cystoisospora suis TaxID=483139 RepID=A0A2C6KXR3_9APIC|nr:gram domain-containing protein [Cystoisospora suis]